MPNEFGPERVDAIIWDDGRRVTVEAHKGRPYGARQVGSREYNGAMYTLYLDHKGRRLLVKE
jgi:hypothetical protein